MFKNLRLKYRILLGYSVPLLLSVVMFVVVYNYITRVEQQEILVDKANLNMIKMLEMEGDIIRMQSAARGYLLVKDEKNASNFLEAMKCAQEHMGALEGLVTEAKQQERLKEIQGISNQVSQILQKYFTLVDAGKLNEALELYRSGTGTKLVREVRNLTEVFEKREMELIQERKAASVRSADTLHKVLIGGTILMIFLAIAIALWISARTSRAISAATNSISASATDIATTVTQHERAATEQAAMVNETTATVDELNASGRQSLEQASATVEVAQRASAMTEEGNQVVVQAIEGMTSLKDKVGVVAEQILRLGEQTSQIGNIANLVKDLATQTNMLALNAAVEAARAGEHGKGFAVVASEVRKLADQSKKSAEEASSLIADIQKATNSTIMVTEESTKTVDEVTRNAQKVGDLFDTLAGEANRVYENAQQVVLNAKQQSTAVDQIGAAINNINANSKETAAGISQTKIGIQNLEKAAQSLQAMV